MASYYSRLTATLNQAYTAKGRAWFLEIALVRVSVCARARMSVCPPPRELITSGMIWCDIGCVRLAKQVLRLPLLLITVYDTHIRKFGEI